MTVTLEEEIVQWAALRPAWQQQVLCDLAAGQNIRQKNMEAIATSLVKGDRSTVVPLTVANLPGTGITGQSVRLRYVIPVEHVNALVDGQVLSFRDIGITCVYGDNGSGKSGYARIVKQVVRARHRGDVLTDIFKDRSTDVPAAVIGYAVNGTEYEAEWPNGTPQILGQIAYYDEACGNAYLSTESAVTYRPSALVLLDGLITVCDGVRDELDRRLASNIQRRVALPTLPEGTRIRAFVEGISATTTAAQVDEASSLPPNPDDAIATLRDEEARLRSSDPTQERRRFTSVAERLTSVANHYETLDSRLGEAAVSALVETARRATQLRAAANVASSATFDAEPVRGVGTDTWRALWDAARRFSEAEAYPGQPFPVADGDARCPLCQQELSADAAARLHRFHQFMAQDTERQAANAQRQLDAAVAGLRSLDTQPSAVAVALATAESHDTEVVEKCRAALMNLDERRTALLAHLSDPAVLVPDLPDTPVDDLRRVAATAMQRALTIDASEFQRLVAEVTAKRSELEGRQHAVAVRAQIDSEITRLAERAKLEVAKRATDTAAITRKSSELTRDHVTAVVRDQFTRESHDLRLRRITLQDTAGRKGQLLHRPAFLGASQNAAIPDVLSEGEQTALGLAGFLTEAFFDQTRSAIILDDPVTSLDHIRRPHVAARLSDFARDHQVIVFTHDVSFVGDLRKAAESAQVEFTERCVERRRDESIGICLDQHPWSARDARARLGQLDADLARIKREQANWDSETYEKEVSDWAGRLSETWERIINLDIVNQVVDRGTGEVRPRMFRMLVRITEDDDHELQQSYSNCSQWARRHDKSPAVNYVAPDVTAMEDELKIVRNWYDRVRKYAAN